MKRIALLTVLFSLITLPFTGYCSYWKDSEDSELGFYLEERGYPKCLLLIDSIKGANESTKREQLKTTLEVEVLYLMDRVAFWREKAEEDLAYQYRMLEEAETPQQTENWYCCIIKTQKNIEKYRWAYGEVEALLKHTE